MPVLALFSAQPLPPVTPRRYRLGPAPPRIPAQTAHRQSAPEFRPRFLRTVLDLVLSSVRAHDSRFRSHPGKQIARKHSARQASGSGWPAHIHALPRNAAQVPSLILVHTECKALPAYGPELDAVLTGLPRKG